MIQYEAVILAALEEVENALVAYAEVQQRKQSLSEATQAAQKAAELAQHKYQAGLTDFTNVLDAQRSLLSFQEQLAQSNGNVTANLVRLYKALGGGWTSLARRYENRNQSFCKLMRDNDEAKPNEASDIAKTLDIDQSHGHWKGSKAMAYGGDPGWR